MYAPRRWTEFELFRLKQLIDRKERVPRISRVLGRSPTSVYQKLAKLRIDRNVKPGRKPTDANLRLRLCLPDEILKAFKQFAVDEQVPEGDLASRILISYVELLMSAQVDAR